jgi:hypothetical protein
MNPAIPLLVQSIPLADTHEHLVEESYRLAGGTKTPLRDIGALFSQYVDSDLLAAGMTKRDLDVVTSPLEDPERKWRIVRPWWLAMRATGYGAMVRESVAALFDINDLTDDTWRAVDERLRALPASGYYRRILRDLCNIDHCQVNTLEIPLFRRTEDPDLFRIDLCVSALCSDFDPEVIGGVLGREPASLDDCLEAIDKAFALHGPEAVAIKNQSAYRRKIDYERWSLPEARESFARHRESGWTLTKAERKPLEDFLFHRTVDKAKEFGLPVKMHTGFHAGSGTMPLHDVRHNAGDMCLLCLEHPDAKFVFMHITYPYQDEAIAVAKHYPNAFIDMCWSWMISPVAAVRFLKEYLLSAPTNKLLVFGGDVSLVELVPGHVRLARRGIAQAIEELVQDRWIRAADVEDLLGRILLRNAKELFPR